MSAGIIAMLQFALFTFLATVALSIAVAVAGYLYGAYVEQSAGVDKLRVKIAEYSRLASGFQDRIEGRKEAAAGSASTLFSSQRLEKQLKQKIRELENSGHRFVRLVGPEVKPNRPFEFLAMNTSVSHQVKRGERHAFYDSSWARPLPIHLWAQSLEDAKERFEQVYPKTVGFKIVNVQALDGAKPAPAQEIDPAEAIESEAA